MPCLRGDKIVYSFAGDDRSRKRRDEQNNESEDSLPELTIDMGAAEAAPVAVPEPRNGKNLGEI